MNSTIATTNQDLPLWGPNNGHDEGAVATPLMQFAYTTWEAVEFVQVAHDTVTSGWWGSAYPDQHSSAPDGVDDDGVNSNFRRNPFSTLDDIVVTLPAGHGTRLQSSSDIAETLPASFIQHRQLITTIGEIAVSKLREVAVVVRTDDNAVGLIESENALLSLMESSMDALAHICEIATLPLHESKGSNAVAASVCVEAAKGVLNIVSELSFLSGADFSVAQRQAAESQKNQILAPHVVTLSTLMKRLISQLSQPRENDDDDKINIHPPTAFLSSFVSRFERIIMAIKEIDNYIVPIIRRGGDEESSVRGGGDGGAPKLGRIIVDVASQVVRHIRALSRSSQ